MISSITAFQLHSKERGGREAGREGGKKKGSEREGGREGERQSVQIINLMFSHLLAFLQLYNKKISDLFFSIKQTVSLGPE